jgi:hypothetical protein
VKPILLYATRSLRASGNLEVYEYCARLRFIWRVWRYVPQWKFARIKIYEPIGFESTSDMETKEFCGAVWPTKEFKSKGDNSLVPPKCPSEIGAMSARQSRFWQLTRMVPRWFQTTMAVRLCSSPRLNSGTTRSSGAIKTFAPLLWRIDTARGVRNPEVSGSQREPHPVIVAFAERGGTQLHTPRRTHFVDIGEQNLFNFSCERRSAGIEKSGVVGRTR